MRSRSKTSRALARSDLQKLISVFDARAIAGSPNDRAGLPRLVHEVDGRSAAADCLNSDSAHAGIAVQKQLGTAALDRHGPRHVEKRSSRSLSLVGRIARGSAFRPSIPAASGTPKSVRQLGSSLNFHPHRSRHSPSRANEYTCTIHPTVTSAGPVPPARAAASTNRRDLPPTRPTFWPLSAPARAKRNPPSGSPRETPECPTAACPPFRRVLAIGDRFPPDGSHPSWKPWPGFAGARVSPSLNDVISMQSDCLTSPANAAAQLMQLGQTEALGVLDQHDGRICNIHADFNHRRRDQNVDLPGGEGLALWLPSRRSSAGRAAGRPAGPEKISDSFSKPSGRGPQIHLFRLLDHRIDDVALPSLVRSPLRMRRDTRAPHRAP